MQQLALDVLREREWELSQLLDMVPGHLWRLAPDGEPTFFNQRMADYLGLDLADTDRAGTSRLQVVIDSIVHRDDATAFSTKLRDCLASGETFAMRYRMRRADGAYRWMSSRAEPQRDQNDQIVQWHGLCHDIDDEMQEALRRDAAMAYDTSEAMAAIATSAQAAHRWLTADPPNVARARRSAERIIRDAETASSRKRSEQNAAASGGGGIDYESGL